MFYQFEVDFYPTGLAIVVLLGIMKTWEVVKKYLFVTDSVDFLTFYKKWDVDLEALDLFYKMVIELFVIS